MGFIAPIVAAVVSAVAAPVASKVVGGLFGGGDKGKGGGSAPQPAAAPAAPSPAASLNQANQDATARRKTILTTGGQTDLTAGAGYVDPNNVQKKNLLGS